MNSKVDVLQFLKQANEIGALMGAVAIGLFDLLENDFLYLKEIKLKLSLKCDDRILEDLLDYLLCQDYLEMKVEHNLRLYKIKN